MPRKRFVTASTAALSAFVSIAATNSSDPVQSVPDLIDMDVIVVPIIDAGQVRGNLNIKLALSAADSAAAGDVTENLPSLRAAAVSASADYAAIYASPYKAVNSVRLATGIKDALQREGKGVQDVLLLEVSARPS